METSIRVPATVFVALASGLPMFRPRAADAFNYGSTFHLCGLITLSLSVTSCIFPLGCAVRSPQGAPHSFVKLLKSRYAPQAIS